MSQMYGGEHAERDGLDAEHELDSGPLNTLVNMRDTFLSRLSVPFRERAERSSVLVWGVENLERADTLTVSFLDRFYRDLQAHPVPLLIVVTVSPDDLIRRPGMAKYSERLLNVARPYGRQLSLVPPGQRKASEADVPDAKVSRPSTDTVEELSVSGSYLGDGSVDFLDQVAEEERQSVPEGPKTRPIDIKQDLRLRGGVRRGDRQAEREDERTRPSSWSWASWRRSATRSHTVCGAGSARSSSRSRSSASPR